MPELRQAVHNGSQPGIPPVLGRPVAKYIILAALDL